MAKTLYEKPDRFSLQAQKLGYPARSVFKLEEIQQKYNLLKKNTYILDIGAAPGSWSLFVLKKILHGTGKLVCIDIQSFSLNTPDTNFTAMQGDIFDPQCCAAIEGLGPYHTVISDAAPNTTGNRILDAGRSFALCEQVLILCNTLLLPGGNLCIKIFQGSDHQELFQKMRVMFEQCKIAKPEASRNESFEVYFIGLRKK